MMETQHTDSAKSWALVVYILQILALFNGFTALVGMIINYVKLSDTKGTWLESHYRWQLTTFWITFVLSIIGFLTTIFFVGFIVLFFALIWFIYRVVKGLVRFLDQRPVD